MMNGQNSLLFDCYIQPEIKDESPDLFDQITAQLLLWNVHFEAKHILASEKEFVLFCSPEAFSLHYKEQENLIIIPLKGEKKTDYKLKKKSLWFEGENRWEVLFDYLKAFNAIVSKKRGVEIKQKLDLGYELMEKSLDEATFSFPSLDLKEREKYFEENILKKIKLKDYSFFKHSELIYEDFNNWDYLFPLWHENEFVALKGSLNKKNANLFFEFLKDSWDEQQNLQEFKEVTHEERLLEETFKLSTLPMAIITNNADIVIHNQSFVKLALTPRQCLQYDHLAKVILHDSDAYKVSKVSIDNDEKMFFFCFQNIDLPTRTNTNSEELGIISSSIAHELNNPLAGIMAALSLLALDDNWSDEALKDLEEMRRGSSRCKALVETFLGFSRMNPQHTLKGTFEQALEQALNLIRFRLVENNFKFSFQKELTSSQLMINSSIFSMVLYLILGDLITSYSHHLLVSKSSEHQNLIEGKFYVEKISQKEVFVMRINTSFDFEESLKSSKLIKHLLDLENYKLQVDGRNVYLSY